MFGSRILLVFKFNKIACEFDSGRIIEDLIKYKYGSAVIELLNDDDEFLRRTAVEILNSVKDERAYFYLVQALNDKDWWVRERAVDALSQMGDPRAVNDLFVTLENFPESAHVLVKALIHLGGKDILQTLLQKANAATGDLRKEMLLAISEFAKKEDIEENNSSMEEIKTRIMADPLRNKSTISQSNQPTVIHCCQKS